MAVNNVNNNNNQSRNTQTRGTEANAQLRQTMLKRFTQRSTTEQSQDTQQKRAQNNPLVQQRHQAIENNQGTQNPWARPLFPNRGPIEPNMPPPDISNPSDMANWMRQNGRGPIPDPIRCLPNPVGEPVNFDSTQEIIDYIEANPDQVIGEVSTTTADPVDPLAQVRDKISPVEAKNLEQMISNGKTFSSAQELAAGLGRAGINVSNEVAESIFATTQLDASEEGITLDQASQLDGDVSMEAVLSLISSDEQSQGPFALGSPGAELDAPPSEVASYLANKITEAFNAKDPSTSPEEVLSGFTVVLEKLNNAVDNQLPTNPFLPADPFPVGPDGAPFMPQPNGENALPFNNNAFPSVPNGESSLLGAPIEEVRTAFARDMWNFVETLSTDMPKRAAAVSVWLTENGIQDPTNTELTVNPNASPLNTFRAHYTEGMDAQAVMTTLKESGFYIPEAAAGPEAAALAGQIEWVLGSGDVSFERVSMLMSSGILNLPISRQASSPVLNMDAMDGMGKELLKPPTLTQPLNQANQAPLDRQTLDRLNAILNKEPYPIEHGLPAKPVEKTPIVDLEKAVALAMNGGTWHFETEFADVLSNDVEFVLGSDNQHISDHQEIISRIQENSNAVGMPVTVDSEAVDYLMSKNLNLPGDENSLQPAVLRLSPAMVSHAFDTTTWLSGEVTDGQLNLGLNVYEGPVTYR